MKEFNKSTTELRKAELDRSPELMIILGEDAMRNYLITKAVKSKSEHPIRIESFEKVDFLIDFIKRTKPVSANFLVVYTSSFKLKVKSFLCQLEISKLNSSVVLHSEENTDIDDAILHHPLVLSITEGKFKPQLVVELFYGS